MRPARILTAAALLALSFALLSGAARSEAAGHVQVQDNGDLPSAPDVPSPARPATGGMGSPTVNTLAPLPGTSGAAGTLRVPATVSSRKKQLQFEDELVEGMNQNPFDSLEHISNQELRDNAHLYKKKAHFNMEMKQHVREAGYSE